MKDLKSYLILTAIVAVLLYAGKIVVTANSNVSAAEAQRNERVKNDYADFVKWANELTPEQRDSVIQLRKAVRGY